jgi:hypothetical protein
LALRLGDSECEYVWLSESEADTQSEPGTEGACYNIIQEVSQGRSITGRLENEDVEDNIRGTGPVLLIEVQ